MKFLKYINLLAFFSIIAINSMASNYNFNIEETIMSRNDSKPMPIWIAFEQGEGVYNIFEEDTILNIKTILGGAKSVIQSPEKGQRGPWIKELKKYRQRLLNDKIEDDSSYSCFYDVNFNGIRSWVRFDKDMSMALALKPGDKLSVALEVTWVEGNNVLCAACDINEKQSGNAKKGWTGVLKTISIPKDGKKHTINFTVEIQDFDVENSCLRPIFGMDATHDPTKGRFKLHNIILTVDDGARMDAVEQILTEKLDAGKLDLSALDRSDLQWLRNAYTCHFTFMYDSDFYDVETGRYKIDELLDEGEREFGGYDIITLWQAYPRLGLDNRNQFDFYREMPGGLSALRKLVRKAHKRRVKVFIDYNPWDKDTRSESKSDEDLLAEMVKEMEVDGIFLDTMFACSGNLREKIDEARKGVVFVPECMPKLAQVSFLSGSWAQGIPLDFHPPLLYHKWIAPSWIMYQIGRWNKDHQREIEDAFFNGSGIMVWENIFGAFNPWQAKDRLTWKRASGILHYFSNIFSRDFEPFWPAIPNELFANRWDSDGVELYTLINTAESIDNKPLLELQRKNGWKYYDLWSGKKLNIKNSGNKIKLIGSIDKIGCIVGIRVNMINNAFLKLIKQQRKLAATVIPKVDSRNVSRSVMYADAVSRTDLCNKQTSLKGMVKVPATKVTMDITHIRRECGCYPDPGTAENDWWPKYLQGYDWAKPMTHKIGPLSVRAFYIDEICVTCAQFKEFLEATKYQPRYSENFLKNWPNGNMPVELADHPVVYVDIDDARAYAKWAGKRLPTEEEWHLAAQGTDNRKWPWGNEFDSAKCNSGTATTPVRAYPNGRSPYGCYDMSGNVWEMTESCRDDGHVRFMIIRGGSYFKAEGTAWYMDGGPRPCDHHAKFIRMWQGLDRCATLGFRCVADL